MPGRLPQVLDLRGFAVESGLEDRIHHHIRVRVGSDRAYFRTHAALVANGDADHCAAVDRRCLKLVRRLEMWIQAAIGIHAGVKQQAEIITVRKDAVYELPAGFAKLFLPFWIPEHVLAIFADGYVGVHATAVEANNG